MRPLIRLCLAAMLVLLSGFWVTVIFYCARSFAIDGMAGVETWLFHVGRLASSETAIPKTPGWDNLGLRFGAIALLTVLLWLANRSLIRQFVSDVQAYWRSIRNSPGRY
jgi:hypothetical protein